MKYIKINTLWKRDAENRNVIMEGNYSRDEFPNIRNWLITEKVDGTNIRIIWDNSGDERTQVTFGGKTDEAQIHATLYSALAKTFYRNLFVNAFPPIEPTKEIPEGRPAPKQVVLFGEGYGPKIAPGGGAYRRDVGFILFDVWVDGWWLQRESVEDIGKKFNIPVVPSFGVMTIEEAIDFVKKRPQSTISIDPKIMEGIVAKSHPLVLFRDGTPVVWKLKAKDYDALDRFNEQVV